MKAFVLRRLHIWMLGLAITCDGPVLPVLGAANNLPPAVRECLTKQKALLSSIYVKYEEVLLKNDREFRSTNTAYFEGDHFLINEDHDLSFDGQSMWNVTIKPDPNGSNGATCFTLRKIHIRDSSEPSTSLTDLYWHLSYFDVAGVYCPKYPGELRKFSSLEPMALRFFENSIPAEILQDGSNLRVTWYVDDWVLSNFRKIDPVIYQKELERTALSKERISTNMYILKQARAMVPKRRITMLLDSDHSYFPVEREDRTADGRLIARFKVEEWRYLSDASLWLPEKSVVLYYTNPYNFDRFAVEPVRKLLVNLEAAEFGREETEFSLLKEAKYKVAGTLVYDEAVMETTANGVKAPVILTVAADGSLLNSRGSSIRISGARRLWILSLLLLLAAPPVLVGIWRRKSNKH